MELLIARVAKNGLPEATLNTLLSRVQQQGGGCDRVTGEPFDNLPHYYVRFNPLNGILFGQFMGLIRHQLGVACEQVSVDQTVEDGVKASRRTSSGLRRDAIFDLAFLQLSEPGLHMSEDPVIREARIAATAEALHRVGAGR